MPEKTLTIETAEREPESRIDRVQARHEKRARMKELAKKVAGLSDDERLQLSARFPISTIEGRALSLHNQCLLVLQANGVTPTVVGGFQQWKRAGRCVRKGQYGLSIWVPIGRKDKDGELLPDSDVGFVCGTVFDVTQTEELEKIDGEYTAIAPVESAQVLALESEAV